MLKVRESPGDNGLRSLGRPFDTEKEPNRGRLGHENAQIEHVEPIEVGIDWPARSEPWKMLLGVAKAEKKKRRQT